MNIADVFFRALLDDSHLGPDAARAGDAAGETLGQHMSSRAGNAIKAGTALLAGAAVGIAAAGAVGLEKLDEVTRRYAADTGATVEETKSAQAAINDLFRKNTNSYEEIGGVLSTLRTSLHLTEAQTEANAQSFLTFAKAVGGPPVETTKELTDVIKAYNLTVDQAPELMDKLVVAHQRYGTAVSANVIVLTQLAPALKAANLSIDDGIGLLDLFAKAGIDAAAAPAALTKALHKIKSPAELQQLIDQIAAEPDDFKRAGLAADLFGVKAGPKLAAALKGSTGDLSQFAITAQDAADATQKAADVVDKGFGEQIVLALHNAQGAVTGFFGFLAGLDPTGFLTQALAPKIGQGLARAFEVAAGLAIVETAIGFAADKAATLYLKGLIFGDTIGGALAKAWEASAGRLITAAEIQGTAAGVAFSGAVAKAVAAAPLLLIGAAIFLGDDPTGEIREKVDKWAKAAASGDVWVDAGTKTGDAFGQAVVTAANKAIVMGPPVPMGPFDPRQFVAIGQKAGTAYAQSVGFSIAHASTGWVTANREAANRLAGAVAQGILDKRNEVDQAWQSLLDMIKNGESSTARTAHLLGELASKELVKGLHAGDPATRAQARYTKQKILDELEQLKPRAGTLSKEAMESLRKAMKSKDPDIRSAAQSIYRTIHTALPDKTDGSTWGSAIAEGLRQGIIAKQEQVRAAAHGLALIIANTLKTGSPSKEGPLSLNGGPSSYGVSIGKLVADGLRSTIGMMKTAATDVAGTIGPAFASPLGSGLNLPSLSPTSSRYAAPGVARGGDVSIGEIHVHGVGSDVSPAAARRFGGMIRDEIASAAGDASGLLSNLRQLKTMSG